MKGEGRLLRLLVKEGSGISARDTKKLYWSMAKTVAFDVLGRKQSLGARATEDKLQRQLISKVDFSVLDEARPLFRKIRAKEKQIRRQFAAQPGHIIEELVLDSRIEIFKEILRFSSGDELKIEEEIHNIEKVQIVKFGIGAAGIALLGGALYKIFSPMKKTKEEEE